MDSPLKYSSFCLLTNVSVGQAVVGYGADLPVGALIRLSTFSCAMIPAPTPAPAPPTFWADIGATTPMHARTATANTEPAADVRIWRRILHLLPGLRDRRHRLHLHHVLRVHRLRAAARRLERQVELRGELAKERVRARKVI